MTKSTCLPNSCELLFLASLLLIGPPQAPTTPSRAHHYSGAGTDLTGGISSTRSSQSIPAQSQIALDKEFDWFTGDAARRACDEDGVQERDNGWCTDYYYRNRNPQLRVVTVSPDATVVHPGRRQLTPVPSDLATVGQRLSGSRVQRHLPDHRHRRAGDLHPRAVPRDRPTVPLLDRDVGSQPRRRT